VYAGFQWPEHLDNIEHVYLKLAKPVRIYILSSFIDPQHMERSRKYSCVRSYIFNLITKEVLEEHIDEESSAT
jgi:hypothetical protein